MTTEAERREARMKWKRDPDWDPTFDGMKRVRTSPPSPLPFVMSWLASAESTEEYPPRLFILGSTIGLQSLCAAEDALASWKALICTSRDTCRERGVRNLELARDIALENLIQFEEWAELARLGL